MLRDLNQSASGLRTLGIPQVGIPASAFPTGFPLPGLLNNDQDAADPVGTLYKVVINSWPSAGELRVNENGSFSFVGAPDGVYTGGETVTKFTNSAITSYDTTYSLTIGGNAGDATAPGATMVGTSSFTGGSAQAIPADATAPGATMVGTSSFVGGVAESLNNRDATAPGATMVGDSAFFGGGAQSDTIGIDITEDTLFSCLRSFIMSIVTDQRVLRTPVNRAAMPVGPYIAMTPLRVIPLATNVASTVGSTRMIRRSSQFDCQIDCYGKGSGDTADIITTLFRDEYGVQFMTDTGFAIAPLYAGQANQLPLVSGEEQYEKRWTFTVSLQFNSVVSTPQQSANILSVIAQPLP